MIWVDEASYFLGGALLANAVPHLVRGMTGQSFQTPFAKPPGKGLSSPIVNVLWGCLNLAGAYGLICWVGAFAVKSFDMLALAAGALPIGLVSARHFGRFHGGDVQRPM